MIFQNLHRACWDVPANLRQIAEIWGTFPSQPVLRVSPVGVLCGSCRRSSAGGMGWDVNIRGCFYCLVSIAPFQ